MLWSLWSFFFWLRSSKFVWVQGAWRYTRDWHCHCQLWVFTLLLVLDLLTLWQLYLRRGLDLLGLLWLLNLLILRVGLDFLVLLCQLCLCERACFKFLRLRLRRPIWACTFFLFIRLLSFLFLIEPTGFFFWPLNFFIPKSGEKKSWNGLRKLVIYHLLRRSFSENIFQNGS